VIFQTHKNTVLRSVHSLGWLLWLWFYPSVTSCKLWKLPSNSSTPNCNKCHGAQYFSFPTFCNNVAHKLNTYIIVVKHA
jgi:hypothetical protein